MIKKTVYETPSLIYCAHREEDFRDSFEAHLHSAYEIYLVKEGTVTYFVEGSNYSAQPGDLFLTNLRELHTPIIKEGCYDRQYIQFSKYFLSGAMESSANLLQAFENREVGQFNKIEAQIARQYGIDKIFEKINQASQNNDDYQETEMRALMIQLLITINRIFEKELITAGFHVKQNEKVKEMLKYMNEHLPEKLSLDHIGKVFFMNPYYLSHLFKKHTGVSIYEYIIHKRIMRAKELIIKELPVTRVCQEVGFEDYSSFYKAFVKLEKKSPKLFLKDYKLEKERR